MRPRASPPPASLTSLGPIRLPLWQETSLCLLLAGLVLSGSVWLVYHHLVPLASDIGAHPVEAWSLRLHGALAMAVLVFVGMLLPAHAWPAWRRNLNRGSGGVMLAVMLLLTVTGYLLYYAGLPAIRETASWLHWGLGLAVPALLVAHMLLGGRWRR